MAFAKKKVEDRKAWLSAYAPGTFLDMEEDEISYQDFVNKVRFESGCWFVCQRERLALILIHHAFLFAFISVRELQFDSRINFADTHASIPQPPCLVTAPALPPLQRRAAVCRYPQP